jgi:Carboxypeptidase regulatory-like domain
VRQRLKKAKSIKGRKGIKAKPFAPFLCFLEDEHLAELLKMKYENTEKCAQNNEKPFRFTAALLLLPSLLTIFSLSIRAQEATITSTLTGIVRDAAGAALPRAQVTLRNLSTNQIRRVITESDGSYRAAALPAGDYEIRVEAPGFTGHVNPKVELALGRTATLDFTLHPGGVSGEITVTDKPPALDPSATVATTSIDPERIAELPVNSRNYLEFTLLAPGVAPSGEQAAVASGSAGASGSALADSGFTFGGLRPRSNSITIDKRLSHDVQFLGEVYPARRFHSVP